MTSGLRVTSGQLQGRILLLPDHRPVTVGSSLERDLILFGTEIQKSHCRVSPAKGGGHLIEALRDAIVQLKQQPIHRLLLKDGDPVQVGSHGFVYHADLEAEPRKESCVVCEEELNGLAAIASICQRCVDRRLLAQRSLEKYKILRKVQMTDLDVTYMALEPSSRRRYSIRIFKAEHLNNPHMVQRFLTRAMVGLSFSHSHFAEVYSIGTLHGACYVVSELVEDAMKLERYLREKTPLRTRPALKVARQFCLILKFAREHRILVGRRRPAGVYVLRNNRVKVSTFDVSRELRESVVKTEAFSDFLEAKFQFDASYEPSTEHQKLDRLNREPKNLTDMPEEGIDVMMLGRVLFQLLSGLPYDIRKSNKLIIEGYGRAQEQSAAQAPEPVKSPEDNEEELEEDEVLDADVIEDVEDDELEPLEQADSERPETPKDEDPDRRGPLARCPKDLLMLLARMVTADPKKRFQTLDEVHAQIDSLLEKSKEP